ncbi:MAG: chorismate synthase [Clostridia bacterium]|nr:chorismate synthase [Clostridia bacterium]
MSNIWGMNLKVSIFGESHGECVGVVISNLPAGIRLDLEAIQAELNRRKPGKSALETPRKEDDAFKIMSGYFNEYTTGAPLAMIIENTNTKSKDYGDIKQMPRPGHADYTAYMKYKGFHDYRGGGHFSGRLTAGIVFAGAVAKQILSKLGISIGAVIESVGMVADERIDSLIVTEAQLEAWRTSAFPVVHPEKGAAMRQLIEDMRVDHNSVGGVIRCIGLNIPVGLGEPFFDSFESRLAYMLFSIPAVKGVAFGLGFDVAKLDGKQANDDFYMDGGLFKTKTNNAGGILGGITNGMPLDVQVAFKPTPSIGQEQQTVNVETLEEKTIAIEGRHDACIIPRAVPVVEAAMAITLLDLLLGEEKDVSWW